MPRTEVVWRGGGGRRRSGAAALCSLLGLVAAVQLARAGEPAIAEGVGAAAGGVEALGWLAGCWASEGGEAGSGEQWTTPAGGTMLGVSRTVRAGRTVATEFVEIRETDGGELLYIATPSGQQRAVFKAIRSTASEVVFENPEHDFPQRILYRLGTDDRLLGRIEGELDGRARAVDFPMIRIPCGGGQPASR